MPSYYDSEMMDNDASSPSEAEDASTDKTDKNEVKGQTTALLPKSILMGKKFKPGEEVVFKIVHEYGDEIEIEYATGEEKDKEEDSMNKDSKDMKESMDQLESSYS